MRLDILEHGHSRQNLIALRVMRVLADATGVIRTWKAEFQRFWPERNWF